MGTTDKVNEVACFLHQLNASIALFDSHVERIKNGEQHDYTLLKVEIRRLKNMTVNFMNCQSIPTELNRDNTQYFDAIELIKNIIQIYKDKQSMIEYRCECKRRRCSLQIKTCPFYFEELCRIFLENAVIHRDPGTPITVRTKCNKQNTYIIFENQAQHLKSKNTNLIWSHLYTRQNKHLGLGLAIAKKIAKLLNLEVNCITKNHQVVQFIITLPHFYSS